MLAPWSSSSQSCVMPSSSYDARGLRPARCAESRLPPLSSQSSLSLSCTMMEGEARPSLLPLSESSPYAMIPAAREKLHLQQRVSSYAMVVLQQALPQQKPQQHQHNTMSTTLDEEISVDFLHQMMAQQNLCASEEPVVLLKRGRLKKTPEAMTTMGTKGSKRLEALVSSSKGHNEKAPRKTGTRSTKNLEERLRQQLGSHN